MAATAQQTNYYTQEQKDKQHLSVLLEKSDEYLLNVFHKHFSNDPSQLYTELNQPENIGELLRLKKRKILKQHQWDKIFPASRKTDSSEFDTTLTFLLIRSLCNYTPKNGWDKVPDANDHSEIANCIRLRNARNDYSHVRKVPKWKYKSIFQKFERPFLGLGCPKSDLNQPQTYFYYPLNPSKNNDLIGLESQLDQIPSIQPSFTQGMKHSHPLFTKFFWVCDFKS